MATLTLTGAGFTSSTSVALVASDGTTTYPANSVSFDTFTQLTATVNLPECRRASMESEPRTAAAAAIRCRLPSP